MYKLLVFAAILAFAVAAPAPAPKPQVLLAGGVPVVHSVVAHHEVVPVGQYTFEGHVQPLVHSGVVVV